MKRRRLIAAGTALFALAGLGSPGLAQARRCDRVCLTTVLDTYLRALAAHDPSLLKFDRSVKYTENGQRLNVGDGLWQTLSAGPLYRFDVVDVEHAQIAMIGIVEENGNRNFFTTRLAVEENEKMGRGLEVTEVENLIVRNVNGGQSAKMAMQRPEFQQMLPEAKRSGREQMERIANAYFTGLDTDESAAHVPFGPNCRRMENGTITANNPTPPPGMAMAGIGCAAQFNTGFSVMVTDIRARRFPVIDREKGLVYALGFFDHNGSVPSYGSGTDAVKITGTFRQPFSFQIAEVFQIESGQINQIEAVLTAVPYKMESGW